MKETPPKKPAIKTAMRIPADLHADLQDVAARAGHSMNTEIINRLTAAAGGVSLSTLAGQNVEMMAEIKRTQEMVQEIIAALSPRR
jgi:predicted HicB family RNase H-like nuclease